MIFLDACSAEEQEQQITESSSEQLSYMIYYGALDDDIIEKAKQYEIVIVPPQFGNITHEQVEEIQKGGTRVFGYISIGEDSRTAGLTSD